MKKNIGYYLQGVDKYYNDLFIDCTRHMLNLPEGLDLDITGRKTEKWLKEKAEEFNIKENPLQYLMIDIVSIDDCFDFRDIETETRYTIYYSIDKEQYIIEK